MVLFCQVKYYDMLKENKGIKKSGFRHVIINANTKALLTEKNEIAQITLRRKKLPLTTTSTYKEFF